MLTGALRAELLMDEGIACTGCSGRRRWSRPGGGSGAAAAAADCSTGGTSKRPVTSMRSKASCSSKRAGAQDQHNWTRLQRCSI